MYKRNRLPILKRSPLLFSLASKYSRSSVKSQYEHQVMSYSEPVTYEAFFLQDLWFPEVQTVFFNHPDFARFQGSPSAIILCFAACRLYWIVVTCYHRFCTKYISGLPVFRRNPLSSTLEFKRCRLSRVSVEQNTDILHFQKQDITIVVYD